MTIGFVFYNGKFLSIKRWESVSELKKTSESHDNREKSVSIEGDQLLEDLEGIIDGVLKSIRHKLT